VFAELSTEIKLLLSEANPGKLVIAVLRGENLFHTMRGFLNILIRVKKED